MLLYPFTFRLKPNNQETAPPDFTQNHWGKGEESQVASEIMITVHNIMSSVNLFIQLGAIVLLLHKRSTQKGPFFIIILIFSLSVSFRVIFHSIALAVVPRYGKDTVISMFLLNSSLYVDLCSNLLSVTITFFLSFNRCLCFVSKQWSFRIFEGSRVYRSIILSFMISILGSVGIVWTSEVTREYYVQIGFLDLGQEDGFRVSINRFFNCFPVGSVICYIILFSHLHRENKTAINKSFFMKRGENKVFAQLLITSFLYIIVNSFYEIVIFIDNGFAGFIALLQLLAVFNYLPEMSLSFLFIVDTIHADKIMRNCMAPKKEVQRITVIQSTSV